MKIMATYDDGNPPYEILKPSDCNYLVEDWKQLETLWRAMLNRDPENTILFFAE